MKQASFKRFTIFFDQYLFISITLLSVMGLFFLYSASQGNINIVMKQAIFVGFGIFLMFILSQPDPDIYKILSLIFLVTSLLLVLITILFAKEINGAKRWLDLGVFTLQPSELVKIALPIYLASYLFEKPIPIDIRNTFKSLLIIGICFFLIARQPDLGTSLLFQSQVFIFYFLQALVGNL